MRLRLADLLTFDLDVGDGESGGKAAAVQGGHPLFFACVAGKGLAGGWNRMCGRERSYGCDLRMCGRQRS